MKKLLFFLLVLTGMVQKAWADTTVTTEDALKNAVQTSQTVTLGQDITLTTTGRLDINGTTVTLDLNGHTLKRPMAAADAGGQVIAVKDGGKLTISDSSGNNSGKITGGWAYQGAGIYVYDGCSLTISGGTITGNRADQIAGGGYGFGGGIENHGTLSITGGMITGNTAGQFGGGIHNEGTLTITGGTITDNNAGTYGGAIYSNSTVSISGVTISGNTAQTGGGAICTEGTLTLDGVTISGNSAQNGGGIYMFGTGTVQLKGESTITGNTARTGGGILQVSNGAGQAGPTLKMQDKPVVDNNTNDNVHLQSYQLITVTGAFSTGARIGVSTEMEQSAFTSGYSTYNPGVAPSTYFFVSSSVIAGDIVQNGSEACIQQTGYAYVERAWDAANEKVTETIKPCTSYTTINGNDTSDKGWVALYNGWYVVTGNSCYKVLDVQGTDVKLIIPDGVTLTVTGGVKLESSHKLSIYGQALNTGKLTVTNVYSGGAGIGGGGENLGSGTLVVHGGDITATGNENGAGIGGGYNAGIFGSVTIYGGKVNAQGGKFAAGIGGGYGGSQGGDITIYGGDLTVVGSTYAAGIGGGSNNRGGGDSGNISIYGGNITASSQDHGAGIGAGYGGLQQANTVILIAGGTLDIHGGKDAAGIGGGSYRSVGTGAAAGTIQITGGYLKVEGGEYGAGIGSGAHRWSGFPQNGGDITISGGELHVQGGANAAGIGGGYSGCVKTVTITGGKVYAKGGEKGAGIGSANNTSSNYNVSGQVTVSGGFVHATGGLGAAGIGGGGHCSGQHVTITGGTVEAISGTVGSYHAAAIGAGDGNEDYGTLSIPNNYSVKAGYKDQPTSYFPVAERVPACFYRDYCYVDLCSHEDAVYTVSGNDANDTHTKHCNYCGTEFEPEKHNFVDGKCSVCGVDLNAVTVTVNVPANNGVTDGAYEAITYQMVPGTTFKLPASPITFDDRVFAGWLVGEAQNNSYLTRSYEELLAAGEEYTITGDVTFTARYSYIYITLANNADNSETLGKYAGKKARLVTLKDRTLYKDGSWNTLCLPFDLSDFTGTPLEGATVKTLTSAKFANGTLTLNFSEDLTAIEAGKPYIVKWASTQGSDNITITQFPWVTINNTITNVETDVVSFNGIFSPYTIEGKDRTLLYLGAGNKLYYPDAAMTIGSCRAYFRLQGGLTAGDPATPNAISAFKLNFGDDESTGITTTNYTNPSDAWYTIDGQLLNGKPTQKGIYINNGKKVVISLKP